MSMILDNPQPPERAARNVASAPPAPRNPRYFTLDLWRGVACLMVVIWHSAAVILAQHSGLPRAIILVIGRGDIGVIGFFVISGYCISATCDSIGRKPQPIRQYFRRRLRRIFPPYWAALLGTAIFVAVISAIFGPMLLSDHPTLLPNPKSLGTIQWLGNILLIENWRSNAFGGTRLLQLGPAWTLCYEEQFYALCGIILLLAPRRFFTGAIAVTALTLALMAAHRSISGLFFDGNWIVFAAGVVVYFIVNYATRIQRWTLTAILALTACACAARYPFSDWRIPMFFTGPVIALLFLALHPFDRRIAGSHLLRPFMFCGAICYSLYLVHWPIVKLISHSLYLAGVRSDWATLLITIPVCLAAALLLGWGFHLAVERRFLNTPTAIDRLLARRDAKDEFNDPSSLAAGERPADAAIPTSVLRARVGVRAPKDF